MLIFLVTQLSWSFRYFLVVLPETLFWNTDEGIVSSRMWKNEFVVVSLAKPNQVTQGSTVP